MGSQIVGHDWVTSLHFTVPCSTTSSLSIHPSLDVFRLFPCPGYCKYWFASEKEGDLSARRFSSLPKEIQLLSNRFPGSLLNFPNFKTFAFLWGASKGFRTPAAVRNFQIDAWAVPSDAGTWVQCIIDTPHPFGAVVLGSGTPLPNARALDGLGGSTGSIPGQGTIDKIPCAA